MNAASFIENFGHLANAPDGVDQIRLAILHLGVQGKLTVRNSDDIHAKKRIEDGVTPVSEIEFIETFDIPDGWARIPLGCVVASNTGGGTPSKSNPSYWGGEISWASVKDIQSPKYLHSTIDKITQDGLDNSSSNLIPEGRLLVVTRMGLGKLAINTRPIAINQDIRAIEPTTALDLDFGYLLFKSLSLVGKGVTVKGIKVTELHQIPVSLPPLAEQKRIVAKVDELMALCDKLESQQQERERCFPILSHAAHERFRTETSFKNLESIFDSDLVISPRDLQKTINALAIRGKLVPQNSVDGTAAELLNEIGEVKSDLVSQKKIRKDLPFSPIEENDMAWSIPSSWEWVRFGTIIINRDGERIPVSKTERAKRIKTYDYYGASGVIDKIDDFIFDKPLLLIGEDGANLINRSTPIAFMARGKYWVNNHAHVIDGISEEFLRYIELFINATNLEPYVTGMAQPKMNQAKMNSIPVALPPLSEQKRILEMVNRLMDAV
ncbi:MAG: restriction endonuclease subunit S, partial [Planctomycetota bacterium]